MDLIYSLLWDCYEFLIFPELKYLKRGEEIKVLEEIICHDRDIQTSERMEEFLISLNTNFNLDSNKLARIYYVNIIITK